MDYLQYSPDGRSKHSEYVTVLNLIINGLPSILEMKNLVMGWSDGIGFKPYYKWITFNT